ncbi:MAG: AAA family ATPase, partial [Microbacterium sp.]|nr:AAA family ATPase [Microbacterium sp.]
TGAGKSSILDGVCFALYGGVPRYDGGEKRLRSDHCDPEDRTEVVLDFALGDARWRLTRAPEYERPKRRGGGFTTEGARAQLDEFVEGEWVGRASGPREVGLALDDVLGLTQQQFLQVILLAQNRFARFLLARNDERQALLRTLFGTRTYEDYQDALDARRKAAEAAVASEMSAVELLLDEAERLVAAGEALDPADEEPGDAEASSRSGEEDVPAEPAPTSAPMGITERIDAVARAAGLARARADALAAARDAAEAARAAVEGSHTALLTLHERVTKRGRARAAVTALEADASAVDADRVALRRAEDAEALRASLEAADRAAAALIAAQAAEQAARAGWAAVGGDVDAGADELRSTADELTGDLAVWSVAAERERTLTELDQRLSALTARADGLVAAVSELDERRRAVPARLDALDAELREVTAVAGTLASARARVAETEAGRAAAEDAARRAEEQREAESRHAASSAAAAAAASAVADLLRRRLADHAGELAEELVAGEACAVCGSLEHPAPAVRTDEPVTDAELTAAET